VNTARDGAPASPILVEETPSARGRHRLTVNEEKGEIERSPTNHLASSPAVSAAAPSGEQEVDITFEQVLEQPHEATQLAEAEQQQAQQAATQQPSEQIAQLQQPVMPVVQRPILSAVQQQSETTWREMLAAGEAGQLEVLRRARTQTTSFLGPSGTGRSPPPNLTAGGRPMEERYESMADQDALLAQAARIMAARREQAAEAATAEAARSASDADRARRQAAAKLAEEAKFVGVEAGEAGGPESQSQPGYGEQPAPSGLNLPAALTGIASWIGPENFPKTASVLFDFIGRAFSQDETWKDQINYAVERDEDLQAMLAAVEDLSAAYFAKQASGEPKDDRDREVRSNMIKDVQSIKANAISRIIYDVYHLLSYFQQITPSEIPPFHRESPPATKLSNDSLFILQSYIPTNQKYSISGGSITTSQYARNMPNLAATFVDKADRMRQYLPQHLRPAVALPSPAAQAATDAMLAAEEARLVQEARRSVEQVQTPAQRGQFGQFAPNVSFNLSPITEGQAGQYGGAPSASMLVPNVPVYRPQQQVSQSGLQDRSILFRSSSMVAGIPNLSLMFQPSVGPGGAPIRQLGPDAIDTSQFLPQTQRSTAFGSIPVQPQQFMPNVSQPWNPALLGSNVSYGPYAMSTPARPSGYPAPFIAAASPILPLRPPIRHPLGGAGGPGPPPGGGGGNGDGDRRQPGPSGPPGIPTGRPPAGPPGPPAGGPPDGGPPGGGGGGDGGAPGGGAAGGGAGGRDPMELLATTIANAISTANRPAAVIATTVSKKPVDMPGMPHLRAATPAAYYEWSIETHAYLRLHGLQYVVQNPPLSSYNLVIPHSANQLHSGQSAFDPLRYGAAMGQLTITPEMEKEIEDNTIVAYALQRATADLPPVRNALLSVASDNAFAMMEKIRTTVAPNTYAGAQAAESEWQNMTSLKGESPLEFWNRLTRAQQSLKAYDIYKTEWDQRSKFIVSVNVGSQHTRDLLWAAVTVEDAVNLAESWWREDQARRRGALVTAAAADINTKCFNCGKMGHYASNCRKKPDEGTGKPHPQAEKQKGRPASKEEKPPATAKPQSDSGKPKDDEKPRGKRVPSKEKSTTGKWCEHCHYDNHNVAQCKSKAAGKPSQKEKNKGRGKRKKQRAVAAAAEVQANQAHIHPRSTRPVPAPTTPSQLAPAVTPSIPKPQPHPLKIVDHAVIEVTTAEAILRQEMANRFLDRARRQHPEVMKTSRKLINLGDWSEASGDDLDEESTSESGTDSADVTAQAGHPNKPKKLPSTIHHLAAASSAKPGSFIKNSRKVHLRPKFAVSDGPAATSESNNGVTVIQAMIDTGASGHIVTPDVPLCNTIELPNLRIDTVGGVIRGGISGELWVSLTDDKGKTKEICLGIAYSTPDVTKNLLSASVLLKPNKKCRHRRTLVADFHSMIYSHGKEEILKFHNTRRKGVWSTALRVIQPLQRLSGYQASPGDAVSNLPLSSSLLALHENLGHPNARAMEQMRTSNAIKGMEHIRTPIRKIDCDSCARGKMTRLKFAKTIPGFERATKPGEVLHMDTVEFGSKGIGGENTNLTAVDDYTKYLWCFPVRSKDLVVNKAEEICEIIHNKTGNYPKRIRCDNGTEFKNSRFEAYCRARGISLEFTPPYTPQRNGVAERHNRTVVEAIRTFLIRAEAPRNLWAHAARYVAYIHNRTHLTRASNRTKTALQAFTGTQSRSDISILHPFACDVLVRKLVRDQGETKLSPVAERLIYIGRPDDSSMFVLDPSDFRVFTTRDGRAIPDSNTAVHQLRTNLFISDEDDSLEPELEYYTMQKMYEKADTSYQQAIRESATGAREARARSRATRSDASIAESDTPLVIERTTRRRDLRPPPTDEETKEESDEQYETSDVEGLQEPTEDEEFYATQQPAPPDDTILGITPPQPTPAESTGPRTRAKAAAGYAAQASARPAKYFPPKAKAKSEKSQAEIRVDRQAAQERIITNHPLDPNRPHTNSKGEIPIPSRRCIANTRSGEQCKRRTTTGAHCFTHSQKDLGLRVKKSEVPNAGRGLYAAKEFRPGDFVSFYTGRLTTPADGDFFETLDGSLYGYLINNSLIVDAAESDRAVARFINDPRGTQKRPNVKFATDQRTKTVRIRATRLIKKGDELLLKYGKQYWEEHLRKGGIKLPKLRVAEPAAGAGAKKAPGAAVKKKVKAHQADVKPQISNIDLFGPTPKDYAEASKSPLWLKAMKEEQDSFEKNGVYTIMPAGFKPPRGQKVIDTKWVLKTKLNENGIPVKAKARSVARGFMQTSNSYAEVSSPTLYHPTLRVILAFATHHNYNIIASDVDAAYLQADLKEEIYIRSPDGFTGEAKGRILKLNKALYGLKQSGNAWHHTLINALRKLNYKSHEGTDACLFHKKSKTGRPIIINIYVDDLLTMYHDLDKLEAEADKKSLASMFKMKDLGEVKQFLGMRFTRDRKKGTLSIDQAEYTKEILKRFGFSECREAPSPACSGTITVSTTLPKESSHRPMVSASNYRQAIGALQWLAQITRFDIAHAVGSASRYTAAPTPEAIESVKRILRYLRGKPDLSITFRSSSLSHPQLTIYSDADWAGDASTASSTTGILVLINDTPVYWCSRKQHTISLSSTEAEYVAASEASRENAWIRNILEALGCTLPPTPLHCDNRTAIQLVEEQNTTDRRKHINVKYHYIRQEARDNKIKLGWVGTADQMADIFTKPLPILTFTKLRDRIIDPNHPKPVAPSSSSSTPNDQ
jgi:transposase InsO family protein